jgi:release factor glutamine methyltransferase
MLWKEQYHLLSEALVPAYDKGEALAIARLVAEHTGKAGMQALESFNVTPEQSEQISKYLQQLLSHRPVQYVLNEAWFYNLKFEVNEIVLIPRPETEELVEMIIKESGKWKIESGEADAINLLTTHHSLFTTHPSPFTILDIGTGSGCIPISIKKNIPEAVVSAIDVCSEALHVAMNNAVTHETEINFQLLDFLDESKWNELGTYDIIVSNPPYIKSSERKSMSEHVLQYEPHKALFVPDDDALIFYKKIAAFAVTHLKPDGKVFVEINQQLGKETVEVFKKSGVENVELKKDMSGNERFVVCSL